MVRETEREDKKRMEGGKERKRGREGGARVGIETKDGEDSRDAR